jgi:thymidylate synthase
MNIELQYLELLKDILENGVKKSDRTKTGTISVFGRQIRHKMSEGFPLLTSKKMYFKGVITELLWFLRGDTNIKYLLDNDCHIWDGDAWANYSKKVIANNLQLIPATDLPKTKEQFIEKIKTDQDFANTWGELGKVYGYGWRKWNDNIDQITNLINDLKTNPDSRRLLVSAWNPSDLPNQVLPPCHYGFQVYTKELSLPERMELWEKLPNRDVMDFPIGKLTDEQYHGVLTQIGVPERSISLMYNTRSQDVPLGTPFNIASYALLLEIIGKMVNMVPDELISNMGDCHIYLNQVDGIKEQLTRTLFDLPKLNIDDSVNFGGSIDDFLTSCTNSNFKVVDYKSHPTIKMPLSN